MGIFLVDDSEIILDRLEEVLSETPQVEISGRALNVAEAKKSIPYLKPQIIISEIRLPGESGIDLLKFVKDNFCDIKFIIFTRFAYPQYRSVCNRFGADYFFRKGIENETMLGVVASLCMNANHLLTKIED